MAITKVILPGGKVDTASGWGKPQTKRAVSQGVAWKVNDVLRAERAVRNRRRLGRRHPSERRQDRDDRGPRRRVVRRLHAAAHDGRLDGVPEGRDPDAERSRRAGRGRDVRRPDLARVHGRRAVPPQGARLPAARQVPGVARASPTATTATSGSYYTPPPVTTTAPTTTTRRSSRAHRRSTDHGVVVVVATVVVAAVVVGVVSVVVAAVVVAGVVVVVGGAASW